MLARRENSCEAEVEAVGKDSPGGGGSESSINDHQPRQQGDDDVGENHLLRWERRLWLVEWSLENFGSELDRNYSGTTACHGGTVGGN